MIHIRDGYRYILTRVKDLTSVGSLVLSEGASFLPPQCEQLVIHPRTHTSNVHQWWSHFLPGSLIDGTMCLSGLNSRVPHGINVWASQKPQKCDRWSANCCIVNLILIALLNENSWTTSRVIKESCYIKRSNRNNAFQTRFGCICCMCKGEHS